jgi:hypothetical protein
VFRPKERNKMKKVILEKKYVFDDHQVQKAKDFDGQ